MNFDLNHHRRTYRACVAKLALSDGERRDLSESLTGHRSSSDFTERNWRDVVAEVQRLAGRPGVQPGQPHLKGHRPKRKDLPYPLDCGATPEQVGLIEGLRRRYHWTRPAPDRLAEIEAVARRWHWDDPVADHGLRQLIRKRAWPKADAAEADAWLARGADLYALDRKTIACAIRILQRMVDAQPTGA